MQPRVLPQIVRITSPGIAVIRIETL